MTKHLIRIGLLMIGASVLLGWLVAHTEVFCADGIRYINQAKVIDQGSWERGLLGSVDHPVYPLAIVAAHRVSGGQSPQDWQRAAQLAAVIAAVLAMIPLYLVAIELIGAPNAWLACILIYMIPVNCHVMADTMSESSFLLFWCFAFWSTLKFLGTARLYWLPPVITFSLLAFLTRPEGLIVPVSLLGTLVVLKIRPSLEFPGWSSQWAIALLVLGPIATAGPFMVLKGEISSKPSLKRILSLTPRAPGMAVERERPLEAEQSSLKTLVLATKAMLRAVMGAATPPMIFLAPLGFLACRSRCSDRRKWLLVAMTVGLSAAAMIRLHETCGYCTPRHAMMIGWLLITAGTAGLSPVSRSLARIASRVAGGGARLAQMAPLIKAAFVAGCLGVWAPATTAPIDRSFVGYRKAGEWLSSLAGPREGLIDLKGFSLYYAARSGYTFATIGEGSRDPSVRWLITHDAHLNGPWDYSKIIRSLVRERRPTRIFPHIPEHGIARVYVYDLKQFGDKTATGESASSTAVR